MKSLLFQLQCLPYASIAQEEALETILFAASFGFTINVLFSAEGVLQLRASQQPPNMQKNIAKMITAFPSFDVTEVFVCKEDLKKYQLNEADLAIPVQLISNNEINFYLQSFDIIITY